LDADFTDLRGVFATKASAIAKDYGGQIKIIKAVYAVK
jgi:hypothetical protein